MKSYSIALFLCLQRLVSFAVVGSELHLRGGGGEHVNPTKEAHDAIDDGSVVHSWELPPWNPMGQPLVMNVDGFGTYMGKIELSPDGKTMAMGTYLEDAKVSHGIAGYAVATYTYVEKAGRWIRLDDNLTVKLPIQGAGGSFDVDVSDRWLVISKVGYNVSGPDEIKAYILLPSRDQTRWFDDLVPPIVNDGQNKDKEAFGESVAVAEAEDNRPIVAVGIPGNGLDQDAIGRVQVYTIVDGDDDDEDDDPKWGKVGPSIQGNSIDYGRNVKLSKNGKTMAVMGVRVNDDGTRRGLVQVFEFSETNQMWLQKGNDIQRKDSDIWFRFDNMDLSSDGSTLVAGVSGSSNDQPESQGHIRVWWYDETKADWIQKGVDIDSLVSERLEPPKNGKVVLGESVNLSEDGNRLSVSVVRYIKGSSYLSYYNQNQIMIFDWKDGSWLKMDNDIDLQFGLDGAAISDDGKVIAGALTDVYLQNVALAFNEHQEGPLSLM